MVATRTVVVAMGMAVLIAAVGSGAYYLGTGSSGSAAHDVQNPPLTDGAQTLPVAGAPLGNLPDGRAHPPISGVQPDFSKNKYTHYRVGNSNVKAMLADGDIVWIGTSGGVVKYDTTRDDYHLYDVRSGLLSNGIFHISKLDDQVVVGTYGGGLSLLDPAKETWRNYNIQHGLADAFVYDVLRMSNGDVWIATWSGANRVRGGRFDDVAAWETYTVANTQGGLPNDWVYGLRAGVGGEVWMATEGGLARYADGRWDNWAHADGLGAPYEKVRTQIEFTRDPAKESSHHARQKAEQGLGNVDVAYNPNYIVALEVGTDGVVWCGTWGGGLTRFDGRTWRNFTVADGLPANHIFMLKRDGDGNFWVGTSKGLARFDGTAFEVFRARDGLYADNVFSLAIGGGKDLWVGSYGGVTRFDGFPKK